MKLSILAAMSALAILTSGCSGCQYLTADKAVLGQTVIDEKVLYGAEAAFYGANVAADSAVKAGLLKGGSPDAVKVADYLRAGHDALLLARAAYNAGDAKTLGQKAAAAQSLIAQAWALIPQKVA